MQGPHKDHFINFLYLRIQSVHMKKDSNVYFTSVNMFDVYYKIGPLKKVLTLATTHIYIYTVTLQILHVTKSYEYAQIWKRKLTARPG